MDIFNNRFGQLPQFALSLFPDGILLKESRQFLLPFCCLYYDMLHPVYQCIIF